MTGDLRPGFTTVYLNLSAILRKYSGESLVLKESRSDSIELIGPSTPYSRGKEVWFGAVRIGKNYVSYHLMPVYAFPDLLEGISPELKKRMQGKSCFNFNHVEDGLFRELDELTQKGYQRYKNEGMIG